VASRSSDCSGGLGLWGDDIDTAQLIFPRIQYSERERL